MLTCVIAVYSNSFSAFAQPKLAIHAPEKNKQSQQLIKKLTAELSKHVKILDNSLVENIFELENYERPYNLSKQESRKLGVRIGSNFFLLIKTNSFRRSSIEKAEYYESFAAFYLVSSRTGRLVFWKFSKYEKDSPEKSKNALMNSINSTAHEIARKINATNKLELNEVDTSIEELPDLQSPEAKNYRPPLPYKRLKPKYTDIASLYDIIATVDIAVEFDQMGNVLKTEIVRWAGFGLDESVIKIVKQMQWRPCERNGIPLPMRVLLRYNFKNIKTNK